MFENTIETIKGSYIPLVIGGALGIVVMFAYDALRGAAPVAAEGIIRYCNLGLTQDQRTVIRQDINKILEERAENPLDPARIEAVRCPGDTKPN